MKQILLQELLEAGCHFGHKSERWHPRAQEFIYTEKDGIHIIDLAKTKAGLEAACEFARDLASQGKELLFVGTKRQAKGAVRQAAVAATAPYLVERWIGGFLTNWDNVKQNIDKINKLTDELAQGVWKKHPKHEQVKVARYLARLKVTYAGVLAIKKIPDALFVVDIRKESAAVAEALRVGIPILAIVDTNADPTEIDYIIPANDDAVGSIQYIAEALGIAFKEGREQAEKDKEQANQKSEAPQKLEKKEESVVSSKKAV